MPKSVERCVAKLRGKVRAPYGVCISAYKKSHGGKAPKMHGGKKGK